MKFGNYLPVWFLKREKVHVYLSESAAPEENTIFEIVPGSHYLMFFSQIIMTVPVIHKGDIWHRSLD
jgi:hypothetical protein